MRTERYAREEARRARIDGNHPRAVEMIQLAIETINDSETLSDLWADLADSLARAAATRSGGECYRTARDC